MKGDLQVIHWLQMQIKNELTTINQYFVHYRMFQHWGFGHVAKKEYDESIAEMKHADLPMDRILMLDGLPNLQDLGKLLIGESLPEALGCDLRLEQGAQATIKEGMAHCESVRDCVSRDLLQGILDDTEEHIDFLKTQLELMAKVGEQNHLQTQTGEYRQERSADRVRFPTRLRPAHRARDSRLLLGFRCTSGRIAGGRLRCVQRMCAPHVRAPSRCPSWGRLCAGSVARGKPGFGVRGAELNLGFAGVVNPRLLRSRKATPA